jgi:hypothetical protein
MTDDECGGNFLSKHVIGMAHFFTAETQSSAGEFCKCRIFGVVFERFPAKHSVLRASAVKSLAQAWLAADAGLILLPFNNGLKKRLYRFQFTNGF